MFRPLFFVNGGCNHTAFQFRNTGGHPPSLPRDIKNKNKKIHNLIISYKKKYESVIGISRRHALLIFCL